MLFACDMRLLTWNIRGCLGMDNRRSVERVADEIRGCDADVVCLQEVHRRLPQSRYQDQPRLLSERLAMKGYFLPSYRLGVGAFGSVILTNLPVRAHRRHSLPNAWERRSLIFLFERRSLLSAEIEVDGRTVVVMSSHFSLNGFDRMKSVERVKDLIGDATGPVVLCGDLNARPESEEMQFLSGECGLMDAGRGDAVPTYPSGKPHARIDYVWHSAEIICAGLRVMGSLASDHLPVVADFETTGREPPSVA